MIFDFISDDADLNGVLLTPAIYIMPKQGDIMAYILVIDDYEFTRRGMVKLLQDNGYQVLLAEKQDQIIDTVKKYKPDCISINLQTPLMNSRNILISLKKQGINIPIVALSEDIQDKDKLKYLELGVVDFINKPPTREVYLQAVNHAITIKQEIKCPV